MELSEQKCVPCEGGTPSMAEEKITEYMKKVKGWATDNKKINKTFTFADFKKAMLFVNQVADLAEDEGHHPDINISYNEVEIVLWTHAIDGLSTNDFVLAAKIGEINP